MAILTPEPVLSIDEWADNGHLIADVARLGFLYGRVLDCTYGYGTFWGEYLPDDLWACDAVPHKSPIGEPADFRALPFPSRFFDCVVFDPPYKLNGTPDEAVDERYGVDVPKTWQDRMDLIAHGVVECARVLDKGYLLVKCQDQVSSGKVRWQTELVTDAAKVMRLGRVDRFDFLGGREQPEGRAQKHARHNSSQLLVFKRGW